MPEAEEEVAGLAVVLEIGLAVDDIIDAGFVYCVEGLLGVAEDEVAGFVVVLVAGFFTTTAAVTCTYFLGEVFDDAGAGFGVDEVAVGKLAGVFVD